MVRYSYRISLKEKVNRDQLEELTNDIEIFLPGFQTYRQNTLVRKKLITYEEPYHDEEYKQTLHHMSIQAGRLSDEAPIVNDIERLR